MNSATGSIVENADDRELAYPRRGMKLVSRITKGEAFRIELADDLFAKLCQPEYEPERAPGDLPALTKKAKTSLACSNHSPTAFGWGSSRAVAFVLGAATAAGLIVGYLAGRREIN